MDRLLSLLQNNARLTNKQLAVMLGREEEEVAKAIDAYEKAGVIRGYQAVIDWIKPIPPPYSPASKSRSRPKRTLALRRLPAPSWSWKRFSRSA